MQVGLELTTYTDSKTVISNKKILQLHYVDLTKSGYNTLPYYYVTCDVT